MSCSSCYYKTEHNYHLGEFVVYPRRPTTSQQLNKMSLPPAIEQISVSLSLERNAIAPASSVSPQRCKHERKVVLDDVLQSNGSPMTFDVHDRMAPFNMCISIRFADHVRGLHRALDKALVDVVQRWYSDKEANFSKRMPLEKHEEDLLEWIYGAGSEIVPSFGERYGM